jgi:hypothetical protein
LARAGKLCYERRDVGSPSCNLSPRYVGAVLAQLLVALALAAAAPLHDLVHRR